ncbi:polysaccharide biosynthesis tyrosine autokinase [Arthrobacter ramosus]|uniref:polysaccharide biosynthesis tyrosine autokinase n=1 Tax=Arthrobacter ramosus TaxID=1672 RepID=UPI003CD0B727
MATTLLGVLVGGGASVLIVPTYYANTELFVAIQNSGSVQELQQGNSFSQARVQSYVKTVQSPVVLQPAIDSLGLTTTSEQLAKRVTAKNDVNTVLIDISVADESPAQAAAIAEAIAKSLVRAVDTLEKPKTGGASPVSLSIITPATVPGSPTTPNTRLNLLIGLAVGLAIGLAAAVLRSTFDSRIRGEVDLRQVTESPLLGGIAQDPGAAKSPLVTRDGPQSPRAESFRQLRTNLRFANVSGHSKTIMVTSSIPGEGKSHTAANLAISLAQGGQSVCLIDADLRRPRINEYMGLDRNAGLTTALIGLADVNDLLQPWGEDNLFVLTSGQMPPNPSELLGSIDMKSLVSRLEDTFDVVVIDTPPILPVTDATVLAQHVGGTIVVVGTGTTRRNELERSLTALKLVEANILGIVMNKLPSKGPDSYTYSYTTNGAKKASKKQLFDENFEMLEYEGSTNPDPEELRFGVNGTIENLVVDADSMDSTRKRFPKERVRRALNE